MYLIHENPKIELEGEGRYSKLNIIITLLFEK